jgi:hypothetical protein
VGHPGKISGSVLTILLFSFLFSSCEVDRKIGKTFIETPPPIQILLFPPDALYKYNHKGEAIAGFDSMSSSQQDSALFSSGKFVRSINDSLFLENYVNSFLSELRKLGFTVYLPEVVDTLLKSQPQVYVLSMAQVQLDEYFYPYDDEAVFYDTRYIKTTELNAVDFSVWYEISKMNSSNPKKTVLYSTHTVTDGLDGSFFLDPFTDDVKYRYRIDSVTVGDVMLLGNNLGRKHASYLYDFFLNQYIAYHMPEGETPYWYYHYNRFSKRLEPLEESEFQILGDD